MWAQEVLSWFAQKFVYDDAPHELDRVAAAFRSGTVEERRAAVHRLTFLEDPNTVPFLVRALRDSDFEVRASAAEGLAYKGDPEAIAPVSVLLSDADRSVRLAAVTALDELGAPRPASWFRALRAAVVHRAPDARVPDLLERALGDADGDVARQAATNLPRHGERGVLLLRRAASESTPERRDGLVAAAEPELGKALEAADAAHRRAALAALSELVGARAVPAIAKALSDQDPEVRRSAVDAVARLGPKEAVSDLLARLSDPAEVVAVEAIRALAGGMAAGTFETADQDRIFAELQKVARWGSQGVQAAAARALGDAGRVSAATVLCALLEEKERPLSVAAACEALGKLDDPRGIAPMLRVVEGDGPAEPAVAAVRALTKVGDVRVVPVFLTRLFAEDRREVEKALDEALTGLCAPAEKSAAEKLHAPEPAARLAAIRGAVAEPRLARELLALVVEGPAEVRTGALEVLSRLGYDVPGLARSGVAVGNRVAARRMLAINLLLAVPVTDSVQWLGQLFWDDDEPEEVYLHAVAALGRIGGDAAKALLGRVSKEHPNGAVKAAAGRLLSPPAEVAAATA